MLLQSDHPKRPDEPSRHWDRNGMAPTVRAISRCGRRTWSCCTLPALQVTETRVLGCPSWQASRRFRAGTTTASASRPSDGSTRLDSVGQQPREREIADLQQSGGVRRHTLRAPRGHVNGSRQIISQRTTQHELGSTSVQSMNWGRHPGNPQLQRNAPRPLLSGDRRPAPRASKPDKRQPVLVNEAADN